MKNSKTLDETLNQSGIPHSLEIGNPFIRDPSLHFIAQGGRDVTMWDKYSTRYSIHLFLLYICTCCTPLTCPFYPSFTPSPEIFMTPDIFVPFLCVNHSPKSTLNHIYLVGNHLAFSCPHTIIFHLIHIAHLSGIVLLPVIVHRGPLFGRLVLLANLSDCTRTILSHVPLSGTTHKVFSLCILCLNDLGLCKLCIVLPDRTRVPPPWAMLFEMSPST